MGRIKKRIARRLAEASRTAQAGPRFELREEAIALASRAGSSRLAFDLRLGNEAYIDDTTFSGYSLKALSAFNWCRKRIAHPAMRDHRELQRDLLWRYKWIVGALPSYPEVTVDLIRAAIDDMEALYREACRSLRPVYQARCMTAVVMGRSDDASMYYSQWQNAERDELADCEACEIRDRAKFMLQANRYADAIAEAQEVLSGRKTCREVPARFYGRVLIPLLQLGRPEEAWKYHCEGQQRVSGKMKYLQSIAGHIEYLSVTGRFDDALRTVRFHGRFVPNRDADDRFHFYLAVLVLLAMLRKHGRHDVVLRLPDGGICAHNTKNHDSVVALYHDIEWMLHELASLFDRRNENDYYSKKISERLQLVHDPHFEN